MRIRVIGIHRDRVEHFLLRGLLPALLARGDAEIIMRRRALRIDPERFRQLGDRIVVFALAIINDPKRGVRKFILGRQGHRFFQGQLRRFQFAGAEIDDPQIRERIEIVGTLRQDLLVLFLRRAILPAIEILFRFPRDRDQFVGDRRLRRRFAQQGPGPAPEFFGAVKLALRMAGLLSEMATTGCRNKASSSGVSFVTGCARSSIC